MGVCIRKYVLYDIYNVLVILRLLLVMYIYICMVLEKWINCFFLVGFMDVFRINFLIFIISYLII